MQDTYPYKRYTIDPKSSFDKLVKYRPILVYKGQPTKIKVKGNNIETKFHGDKLTDRMIKGDYVYVGSNHDDYDIDKLSDYFIEDVRVRCKRYDQEISPHEYHLKTGIRDREELYKQYKECNQFKPTLAVTIIDIFKPKSILDFSAGWGDRLLAAMARGIMYTGIDPNTNLMRGHSEMISMFGDPNKHKVIYSPAEDVVLTDKYDMIYTSPPFYDLEQYSSDSSQSMISNPTFEQWITNFLFKVITKCWTNLKVDGYMVLHIGDSIDLYVIEPTILYILYTMPDAEYMGSIQSSGKSKVPNFVFKKKVNLDNRLAIGESFCRNYPLIYSLI